MTDPNWAAGDWMQTHSGRRFYPMSPDPDQIDADDIAHALSLLCRYGGHVDRFYSVAEHCVLMSYAVPRHHALNALLHDATEAYVVDVPRPVKRYLSDYAALEESVAKAIAQHFGTDYRMDPIVKDADNRILLDERAALLSNAETGAWAVDGLEPLGVTITGWLPNEAKQQYLNRLGELV